MRGIAERVLGALVVVVLAALPAAFHVTATALLIVLVVVALWIFAPTIFTGGGGRAAIIRAETAAAAQRAKDQRAKIALWALLIGGAVVFAVGLLDLYFVSRIPAAVDIAFMVGGAASWGVKITLP